MSKKVTSPDILEDRIAFINSKTMWFFVDIINESLFTNKVESDGRILVEINYNINDNLVERLIDLYIAAGWKEVNVTFTGSASSLYGSTIFEFVPPTILIADIKRRLRQYM